MFTFVVFDFVLQIDVMLS